VQIPLPHTRRSAPRIVSLCASNTELLSALGALDLLVGCDRYSDYPGSLLKGVPRVGGDLDVEIERVRDLQPDLILASLSVPGMERVVEGIRALGIPYVIYDPIRVEDIFENLLDLGERLGRKDRALRLVEKTRGLIVRIQARASSLPLAPLVVEWWPRPIIVPFRESWVNEVLSWVNLYNPFANREGRSGAVELEEIVAENPRYYAISWCGVPRRNYRVELVQSRFRPLGISPWILPLWEGWIGRPSLRILWGARYLLSVRLKREGRCP